MEKGDQKVEILNGNNALVKMDNKVLNALVNATRRCKRPKEDSSNKGMFYDST